MHARTHACMRHTHTHTHAHTYIHIPTHARTQARTYACMLVCMHAHTLTHSLTHHANARTGCTSGTVLCQDLLPPPPPLFLPVQQPPGPDRVDSHLVGEPCDPPGVAEQKSLVHTSERQLRAQACSELWCPDSRGVKTDVTSVHHDRSRRSRCRSSYRCRCRSRCWDRCRTASTHR